MSIPFSHTPYPNTYAAELDELDELIADVSEIFESEAEGGDVQSPTDLGGDSAFLTGRQTTNFISEQIAPLLAQQSLLTNGQLETQRLREAPNTAPDALTAAHDAIEDKNITANYLFALSAPQRVSADMNKPSNRHDPRRDSQQRNEMQQLLQYAGQAAPVSDEELGPMIEAIVKQTPQVAIELPGGVELRITLDATGKPSVMYVNPDGTLRTLAKGKTLRLNRWVNGITLRNDGTIAMLP